MVRIILLIALSSITDVFGGAGKIWAFWIWNCKDDYCFMKPENSSNTIAFIRCSQFSLKIMIPWPFISGDCTWNWVGCFKDRRNSRAIGGGIRPNLDSIDDCKNFARTKGWTVCAVQSSDQCFTAANAGQTYDKYGEADNCQDGRGDHWSSDVYEFICGE